MRPLLATVLVLLAACGSAGDERYRDQLLPLVPGATWDYRTADRTGAPGARTVRVAGEAGGGLVLETRENGSVRRSFLEVQALVLAVREVERAPDGTETEELFTPGALRGLARADLEAGDVFEHRWTGTREGALAEEIEARWTVEAVGETVNVAAGLFEDAVRIRRTQSDGNDALLWYAPGVGLVRARGAEQLELVHWALP
ncbi:hypothetical protein [Vulgatibacter sp.]|uniref:hypothetical protein n=1 Tax=Vulgatibacter sp. TaxID=1971226 RepID=UPI003565AB43